MICPECRNEMYICGSTLRVSGDQSPDTETVVERVLRFVCRNPQCAKKSVEQEEAVRLL